MLNYNELKPRVYIIHEDEPWEVIDAQVSRKQQNKPVNKTKLKNLINGRVIDYTFHVSDKIHEADMSRRALKYLYYQEKKDEYWFADAENPKDRFVIDSSLIEEARIRFIKENSEIDGLVFTNTEGEEQIVGLKYPTKVELEVTQAPPNIKGDTATGGRKTVTVETGAEITTPLFINVGDIIAINTESAEYSERIEKK